ncbi:hypothetical protein PAEPH01_1183 [Pancytospora epiphaga]|nr:hypothetical protein PAEPH01_1183 [Pancytospora epiphaga]
MEVEITSQGQLTVEKAEKMLSTIVNKFGQEYECRMRIIPYVMTWDGVVTKYLRRYLKNIGITDFI